MSTIVRPATPLATGGRMTVDEFERFAEGTDERFELIDGQPVRKPDMNPDHVWATEQLKERLGPMLPGGWFVRDDKPVEFAEDSQPQPDIAVVRGDSNRYRKRHPRPDEAALLVEVSWSTHAVDRGVKRPLYGSHEIPFYWIVDTLKQRVEVYSDPGPNGYATCVTYERGEFIRVVIEGEYRGEIAVNDFMPELDAASDDDVDPAAGGNGA